MIQDQFRKVPEWGAAFKVRAGHGFEKVVYAGSVIGVTGGLHRHNEELEATLLCYCHPHLAILPITAEEYYAMRRDVNQQLAA